VDERQARGSHCQKTAPSIELGLHAHRGACSPEEVIAAEPTDRSQSYDGDAEGNNAAINSVPEMDRRSLSRAWTEVEREELRHMWLGGATLLQIASRLRRSRSAVERQRQVIGLPARNELQSRKARSGPGSG
jgi:hypothetical protein